MRREGKGIRSKTPPPERTITLPPYRQSEFIPGCPAGVPGSQGESQVMVEDKQTTELEKKYRPVVKSLKERFTKKIVNWLEDTDNDSESSEEENPDKNQDLNQSHHRHSKYRMTDFEKQRQRRQTQWNRKMNRRPVFRGRKHCQYPEAGGHHSHSGHRCRVKVIHVHHRTGPNVSIEKVYQ